MRVTIKELYYKAITEAELQSYHKVLGDEKFTKLMFELLETRRIKISKLEHDYQILHKKQIELVNILKKYGRK